jgi:hypothetical protein
MAYRDDLQAALVRAKALEKENALLKRASAPMRVIEVHPPTCAIIRWDAYPPWTCDCGVALRARRLKAQRAAKWITIGVTVGVAILYTVNLFFGGH